MKHPQKQTITAVCWNPKEPQELAYCDSNGCLGLIENVIPEDAQVTKDTKPPRALKPRTKGKFG